MFVEFSPPDKKLRSTNIINDANFAVDSEFNEHFIAIGLQYKKEYENEMVGDFADVTAQIVDIEMYM